jgi:uncharacterized membrane protein
MFAADFQFISFDIPGALLTRPFGVNAHGQVVGLFRDAGHIGHGFLVDVREIKSGRYTQIDVPGATFTNATGINARGDVIGRWTDNKGYNHGFLQDSTGGFTLFDAPPPCVVTKSATVPHGINDLGNITGRCFDSNGKELGFLWRHGGTFRVLDYPGSLTTDAWMSSNSDEVVGDYSDASGVVHGYIWTDAAGFVSFNFPGARDTGLRAVNERGDITGVYDVIGGGRLVGFWIRDQLLFPVVYPESIDNNGTLVINESGLIVAGYFDSNEGEHGFVAVECPPSGCR